MIRFPNRFLLTTGLCLTLPACGMLPSMDDLFPDRKNEYKETREIETLEIPPGLSGATMTEDGQVIRSQPAPVVSMRDDDFDSPYAPKSTRSPSNSSYDVPGATPNYSVQNTAPARYAEPEVRTVDQMPAIQAQPLPVTQPQAVQAQPALSSGVSSGYVLMAEAQPPFIQTSDDVALASQKTEIAIAQAGYQISQRGADGSSFGIQTDYVPQQAAETSAPKKGLFSRLAFWRDDDEPVEQVAVAAPVAQVVVRVVAVSSGSRILIQDLNGAAVTGPVASSLLGDIHWQLQ